MNDDIVLQVEEARAKEWERCGCTMKCSRMRRREENTNICPASKGPNTTNHNSDADENDTSIKRRESNRENEWEGDLGEHTEERGNDLIGAEKRSSKDISNRRLN